MPTDFDKFVVNAVVAVSFSILNMIDCVPHFAAQHRDSLLLGGVNLRC